MQKYGKQKVDILLYYSNGAICFVSASILDKATIVIRTPDGKIIKSEKFSQTNYGASFISGKETKLIASLITGGSYYEKTIHISDHINT
jgi:DNA primase